MRFKAYTKLGVVLGVLGLGGCGEPGGEMIPPSQGQGTQSARDAIESPFGPAKNLKAKNKSKRVEVEQKTNHP